ncbi:DnaD domain protein [Staphylococcus pseudintermedius]|uniref:DnaD domain protein n=2 Tax=Staphylococcus pseudintermedius TaxID=283734 RepID=UPI00111E3816|nr:DnaD domain protein [Staphylococcus pseudintermedius]EGQ0369453.1 DnaD domain protein [Staphylococcus pseudintermedius]EGQ2732600.1 DnaD domain protein [Staphylococcus pseudintermedius]EGQ3461343.1 DnaD domain protein [Staphylococcus pseudintermedius]EGQ3838072.1 DnaD domain protein [Staphylococcus pseudintermedius]EHS7163924.1 DnaD domain protein [Staphylococcus pseudintermedius]
MNEQPSYYAIITANVRYDNRLTDSEKILFAEITALSNKYGYCTATNGYFASLYEVTKVTISRRISKLKEHGYLDIEIVKENNEFKQRKLYPLTQNIRPINTDVKTPINTNVMRGINTNVKHNNTSNNNTRKNNTRKNNTRKNNNHHLYSTNNIYSDPTTLNQGGESGSNPYQFFQENGFGHINSYIAEDISMWINDFKEYGNDMVIEAMKIAIDNKKNTWSYTKSILKRWINERIMTPKDIQADEKARESHKKQPKIVGPDGLTPEERAELRKDPSWWD